MKGILLGAALMAASPVHAQTIASPAPSTPLTSVLDADVLRDLPSSDNLFQILETTQPSVISDRFSGGGLYGGQAARVGSYFGSSSQTLYRIGDVTISDPTGSGTPLAFPDLALWQRIHVVTGVMPIDTNAVGLAITLEPLEPTRQWVRTMFGSASHFGAGAAPAIARLGGWDRASVTATGPLIDGRLGGAFTASWNHTSQFDRGDAQAADLEQGSASAHLVFTPSERYDVRALGWLQRSTYPFALRRPFGQPNAATADESAHGQIAWDRHPADTFGLRVFGAYTQRTRTTDMSTAANAMPVVFERLADGPVDTIASAGSTTVRQWSIGWRLLPARTVTAVGLPANARAARHAFDAGVELSGARSRQLPTFFPAVLPMSTVGELVNGLPARVWMFSQPGEASLHRETTIAAYATDHVQLTPRLSIDAGLRFDSVGASADGAGTHIRWSTWLPRASVRWAVPKAWGTTAFAGYGRSAQRLPLDLLAVGDPAAPTANVFRWDAEAPPAAGAPFTSVGPLVARVGPGTGGVSDFSAIDAGLKRPYTDELVIGLQTRPRTDLTVRLVGIARREHQLIGLVNTGVTAAAYSLITVPDVGIDLATAADDQALGIYNRLPSSFGLDRYLLTNPDDTTATSETIDLSVQVTRRNVLFFVGGSASRTDGAAANRGYGPLENDEALVGELYANPNAAVYARGRLFNDRAYTGKVIGIFRLPKSIRVGLLARYQDGQPFARLVVAPGLNQGAEAVRAFANGGSRFMFTGTLDARVQKGFPIGRFRVDAVVDAFNVLNMSNEVEEDIVTGPGFRTVTAVQPPRAFHVGVRVTF